MKDPQSDMSEDIFIEVTETERRTSLSTQGAVDRLHSIPSCETRGAEPEFYKRRPHAGQ